MIASYRGNWMCYARWTLLFCMVAAQAEPGAQPVQSRVEQARQFQPASLRSDSTAQSSPLTANTAAPEVLTGSDDSFGEQQLLKRQEAPKYFNAWGSLGAFYTDNVALAPRGALNDSFLVGSIGVSYQRPITPAWRMELSLAGGAYRYDKYTELDFQSVDFGAGLVYRAAALADAEFFGRYGYTELRSGSSGDSFYHGHTLTLGVQKAFVLSRAQGLYGGLAASLNRADPRVTERDELGLYGGYRLQVSRRFSADLGYRIGYQRYPHASRNDWGQTGTLTLRYQIADWLGVNGTTSFTANRSNRAAFRYNVANAGLGLALDIRF